MKENHDKHQVVLAVENYEALLKAASESPRSNSREIAKIKRHVRKFNSPQKAKRAVELKEEETQKWCRREDAKKLVREFEGKSVIVMYHYPDKASIGLPGTLRGYSNQGVGMVAVKIHNREYGRFGKCTHLLAELVLSPEEYERECKEEIQRRRQEAFKELEGADPETLKFRLDPKS